MIRTCLLFAVAATALSAQTRALLLISIDGMGPAYVGEADRYGLKIPNLRRIYAAGAHAAAVRGVLPTVTYPSHTTIMTGVWPAKHGISLNTTFDPLGKNQSGWYWYSEDIRVPTLWEAAHKAGYVTGSVSWPVTAGARGIDWLIPEYWRSSTAEDVKLLRLLSTPGLVHEIEADAGPYITNLDDAIPGDRQRTRYAEAIIRRKHPRFMLVHLAALDHLEHAHGPFSKEALATLEEMDGMIGALDRAMREQAPDAATAIVSDHGFAAVSHQSKLREAFLSAGLLSNNDWKAAPWDAGGMALIVVKDSASRDTVAKLLSNLALDPAYGIDRVLSRQEIARMGGAPNAEFAVDLKPGYSLGAIPPGGGGTHGFSPTHPEMFASFFIAGPGIARGRNLGEIDMRSIAPTLAGYLGVEFRSGDLPPLSLR